MRVARSGPPARGEQALSLSPPKSSMQPPISTPATSKLATELNRVFFRVPRSPFRVPRSTFGVSVHPLWLRCLWPAFPSSPSRVARPRAPADCHWCPLATRSTSSRLTSGCSRRTGGLGRSPRRALRPTGVCFGRSALPVGLGVLLPPLYLADEVKATYGGMMIAIPEKRYAPRREVDRHVSTARVLMKPGHENPARGVQRTANQGARSSRHGSLHARHTPSSCGGTRGPPPRRRRLPIAAPPASLRPAPRL